MGHRRTSEAGSITVRSRLESGPLLRQPPGHPRATTGLMPHNGPRYSITSIAATVPLLHAGKSIGPQRFGAGSLPLPYLILGGFADPGRCVGRNTKASVELEKIL